MKNSKRNFLDKISLNTLKVLLIGSAMCVPGSATAATYKDVPSKDVIIQTEAGMLKLIPLNDNSIRVRFIQSDSKELEELIYLENLQTPKYKVRENNSNTILSLDGISAEYSKTDKTLTFKDRNGKVVLKEKAGGRLMNKSVIQGIPTYQVEQQFISPSDEYIYGTGQFQDGYLNARGLTRRLTQVNTQISIPFILSSKGYGLLWNNYGLQILTRRIIMYSYCLPERMDKR